MDRESKITLLWKDKKVCCVDLNIYNPDDTVMDLLREVTDFFERDKDFTLEDLGLYTKHIIYDCGSFQDDIDIFNRKMDIHIFVNFELECDGYYIVFANYKNLFDNENDLIDFINKRIYNDERILDLLESIKKLTMLKYNLINTTKYWVPDLVVM